MDAPPALALESHEAVEHGRVEERGPIQPGLTAHALEQPRLRPDEEQWDAHRF